MKKLEKTRLDKIGKAVVKADALSPRDLEKIVANPALFDSVRARIASGNAVPTPQRRYFRPVVASFASVGVIAVAIVAVVMLRSKPVDVADVVPPPITVTPPQSPQPMIGKSTKPDQAVNTNDLPPPVTQIKPERISTRPNIRSNRPKQPVAQQVRYEGNFYALSYAGDPNETERGGRIVRVDIPRSTLFAMGVYIPLENEKEMVKTDLLVGPDGVTRAIRVVE